MRPAHPCDRVVVVGGGIAGLATALHLAPLPVTLLVASPLGQHASTPLAQGGIAAALGEDDRPALHAARRRAYDFDSYMRPEPEGTSGWWESGRFVSHRHENDLQGLQIRALSPMR